jgi:glucan phosphoethanolaminetransferase (alkaline phosphatase superfamily)
VTTRRLLARALVLAPALSIVALDFALRGRLLRDFTREAAYWYAGCAAAGALAWGALIVASARRRGATRWAARVLLAAVALLSVGTQLQTWARYRAYLNWRTALMGNSLMPCLSQQLAGDRARVLLLLLAPVAVMLGLVVVVRRLAPPRRRAARLALPLGCLALLATARHAKPDAGWDSGTTPDVLWMSATYALAESMRTHEDVMVTLRHLPDARSPEAVPAMQAAPARPRNVLLLIDESVRADDACSVPVVADEGACDRTPFTNRVLPDRYGFRQMRSLDSTTALSMAALLTGLGPSEPRASLLSAPLLFEYAHAAGVDTAFWTSQNLLYANAGRFLDGTPLHTFVSGTELEPYADYLDGADDARLLRRVAADLPALREPYLAVVQLANTHFPYKVDEHDLPFSSTHDWRKMDAFGRTTIRYHDALHRQDKLLARFLATISRERTVVVFLSDHGEQIGEHRRTGHTWTEYEQEVHVPMWIDAPAGTLTDDEARRLEALRDVPLTMLDVAPTLLDLLGLWNQSDPSDRPALSDRRRTLLGVSMLRGAPAADRALVMTNCSELFSCSSPNWGVIRGSLKLFASEEDSAWHCFDVATDPDETHDLGPEACSDLRVIAEGGGRGTPFSR